jgi:hypothetical protein
MPFNGHLVITDAIGKGLITLVSALGGARPIFVFTMTALGGDLREIHEGRHGIEAAFSIDGCSGNGDYFSGLGGSSSRSNPPPNSLPRRDGGHALPPRLVRN